MGKIFLCFYISTFFLNFYFKAEDDNREKQYLDFFLKKRSKKDYDFVKIKKTQIYINVDLYDQVCIKSDEVIYEQSGLLRFENGVQIDYFDKTNCKLATVKANSAFFNISEKIFLVKGYVKIVSYDKGEKTINTDILFFDQESKMCFNNSFLKIFAKDFSANGQGIYSKDNFSYYKIKKPRIKYNQNDD